MEADKNVLELMNKQNRENELAQKKPNIARKTAKPADYMASESTGTTSVIIHNVNRMN